MAFSILIFKTLLSCLKILVGAFKWQKGEGLFSFLSPLPPIILVLCFLCEALLIIRVNTGQYLQAEVDDGGFGRDVLEFLVKGDVVAYRSIATKVTYVYPFTTALGDSKGQEERMKKIVDQLGWYAPSFDTMD